MARRQPSITAPPWAADLPVLETVLTNGLKVLVLPREGSSTVVCDLYYPAGSVNEPAGRSGLAHFVEHMLFKGTDRFPKGHVDRLTFAAAGQANAETSEDATHYWFAFPSDRWELALPVEADRMRGARFDPAEVEAERHVIVEERARDLDSPLGRIDQTHLALSYLVHPYRNPVLGWPDDLRRASVADLRGFYDTHYRPDGAVMIVVGGVEPSRVFDRVEAHFGVLKRGTVVLPNLEVAEPRQAGRRDFTLRESDAVARGLLGWHSVPRDHPDVPALDVLSDILTCGRRSRLWDALVERGRLATYVDAAQEPSRLAGQFLIQVEAAPGAEPRKIEDVIRSLLEDLADQGPTDEELGRSRNRLESAWRWEQEDQAGLAAGLGQAALWGNWRTWQAERRGALAVSAEDIRRVASMYLVEDALTAGWCLPRSSRSMAILLPSEVRPNPAPPRPVTIPEAQRPLGLTIPRGVPSLEGYLPARSALSNGLRVISERRPGTGTVAIELHVDAGQVHEARPGLAHLVGRMREEGTSSRSAEDLAGAIEDVGGVLEIGSTGASLRVRSEDLPLALEILADLTLRPAFPREALAWAKRRTSAELQADRDDPSFRAEMAFRALVYGDHPLGRDPRGTSRQLSALTLDDVRDHHDRLWIPGNAFLVAVGDFEDRRLKSLLRSQLGPWSSRGPVPPRVDPPLLASRPRLKRISQVGEQVHILIGHLGIRRDDEDFAALAVLDHVLGSGPGFTDRLGRIIRDQLGLAYSVGGGITDSADDLPGLFRVYLGTNPDDADRAVAAVLEQVGAMHRGEFGDDEVERARRYLAGSWIFDYQTVGQRADRLLELERWGLPLDEPLQWPGRVARVTPGQVRRAARRHLHPDALARVEFGPIRRRTLGAADAECA